MINKLVKFRTLLMRKYWRWRALRSCGSHKGEIFCGGKTILTANTFLGNNPNFNGIIVKGRGSVCFGDNFHSGFDCLIISENHNYEGSALPYDETFVTKNVYIGDNVWFGDKVTILGGVKIGEGAIIQAGAVVVNDIPQYAIAGGNPAKVFKYRNKDHYDYLKAANRFH